MANRPTDPQLIPDERLEQLNSGLGLLVPAVQVVREEASHSGGANVALGDGSVRFLKSTTSY